MHTRADSLPCGTSSYDRLGRNGVSRRNVTAAYDLASPELRQGQTRSQWRAANAVVPFTTRGIAGWSVLYSYCGDVAFNVALVGDAKSDVIGKSFIIELKRYREGRRSRWLVTSWAPNGVTSAGQSRSLAAEAADARPSRAPLDVRWLLLPAALLSLIFIVPLVLAVKGLLAARHARRRFELG